MFCILQIANSVKRKILFLLMFSMIEFVCSVSGLIRLGGIISIVLLYITILWDRRLPLCVYIITSVLGTALTGVVTTINAVYLSFLALYSVYRNFNNKKFRIYFIITMYFFVVLFFSFVTGINSHLDYAIKIIVASLIVLQVASCGSSEDRLLVLSAVLCGGISMSLIVFYSIYSGAVDVSMRLQYDENSKTLSTALAPLILTAVYLLLFGNKKKNKLNAVGLFTLIVVLLFLLVRTYSRGVLIALIISILYLCLRYMGKMSFRNIITPVLFLIVVYFFVSKIEIDNELMFENVEGGNGRTMIWSEFFQQLKDTNSLVFGFGPGFTKDVSRLGFYSHSTILDYLFCYGIAGFIYILSLIVSVSFQLFNKNNRIYLYQGLFLLSVIMFSTHGSAGTLLFNIILGLCMSVVIFDNKEGAVN